MIALEKLSKISMIVKYLQDSFTYNNIIGEKFYSCFRRIFQQDMNKRIAIIDAGNYHPPFSNFGSRTFHEVKHLALTRAL